MAFKSQAGVEFIILVSFVMSICVIILANSFKEMELNMAIATVRTTAQAIASEEGISAHGVFYEMQGNTMFLNASFSDEVVDQDRVNRIGNATRAVIGPNSEFEEENAIPLCFSTTRRFCIS